ncbi:SHOCT domain-containing protein [Anaerotalea alkaliphila]|uniref:SHOCT domain-containing protein n=1 Tax=Anaerotalea alkaliphila TaxID=2662126 RepID=A0A7X5HTX9_9FIRM|nr:SHOCT domain-containing protein [Anaerotalea alkaliphila]NDL66606.1 hypothetical protein [Anaerotalea alkaliphila]
MRFPRGYDFERGWEYGGRCMDWFGGPGGFLVGGVLLLLLLVAAVLLVLLLLKRKQGGGGQGARDQAMEILKMKLVNGEIDEEEYQKKKELLERK